MQSTHVLRHIGAFACALLASACAPTSQTPTNRSDVQIERTDKEFDIGRDITRIAIDNPWGEINVRGRDERQVAIHAVLQRMPPRFPHVEIRSHRDGDTLRIEVVVAGGSASSDHASTSARADLAVYVPGDLALALTTRDGRIAVSRRIGAIEATSDSGEIHAASRGRLELHSGSGQIRAIAIGKNWPGASDIATDSGRIVLLVPTFGDIALEAHTGGSLSTGFGLSVHSLANGGHEAHARYGAGTSPLRAQSTSGEIVLEQLVLLGDDKALPEDDD